jgi:hypothetical protein
MMIFFTGNKKSGFKEGDDDNNDAVVGCRWLVGIR